MKNELYDSLALSVENALEAAFCVPQSDYKEIYDAMAYSVLGGGKRIRGVLMLECARICGLDRDHVMPFACAIEMIHASTLIHDDLPCMDNDDFRRGKPSCHKVFGEDVALLAGDALYAYAISYVLKNTNSTEYTGLLTDALSVLLSLAGADGVFGGQILDKKYEKNVCLPDQLLQLHALKTGALFSACGRIPAILSRVDVATEKALRIYMNKLGLAFQVKDDLLDLEGDFKTLGKATGVDENKSTFITVFGAEYSKEYLNALITDAKEAIRHIDGNDLLLWICDFVMNRNL